MCMAMLAGPAEIYCSNPANTPSIVVRLYIQLRSYGTRLDDNDLDGNPGQRVHD